MPDSRQDLPVARSPMTLDDLLEGLLWPKLLRSAALALAPGRLALAAFLVFAVFALDISWRAIFHGREPGPLLSAIADLKRPAGNLLAALLPSSHNGVWTWAPDLGGAGRAILDLFITVPKGMLISSDGSMVNGIFATLILLPIAIVLTAIAGGAICRSVAVEVATGQVMPWTKALRFALSRWGSLVGAILGPVMVVWAIGLVLMAAGWLMKWPVLNLLGGLFFPLLLLLALLAAVIMAAYVLGHIMLLPSVAADGADGFDAIQRAYAYVYGRPLRLLIYLAILLVQGVVAFLLVASLVWVALALADQATGLNLAAGGGGAGGTPPTAWDDRITYWLVSFWVAVVKILTASYAISLYFSGGTVLYLLMRRLNDDQDMRDIWMPDVVEAVRPAPTAEPAATPPAPVAAAPPIIGPAAAPANPDPADYA